MSCMTLTTSKTLPKWNRNYNNHSQEPCQVLDVTHQECPRRRLGSTSLRTVLTVGGPRRTLEGSISGKLSHGEHFKETVSQLLDQL